MLHHRRILNLLQQIALLMLLVIPGACVKHRTGGASQQAVVVTAERHASEAGARILRAGGNAADARWPWAMRWRLFIPVPGNLGGGGFAITDFKHRIHALDFREVAPQRLNMAVWRRASKAKRRYLSIGVPGSVAGLNALHDRYAKLPLSVDMQPAIQLASKGFILHKGDMFFINDGYKKADFSAKVFRIFPSMANV